MIKELVLAGAIVFSNTWVEGNTNITLYWKTNQWQNESSYSIRSHEIEELYKQTYEVWQIALEYQEVVPIYETPTIYDISNTIVILTRIKGKVENVDFTLNRQSNFYSNEDWISGETPPYEKYYIDNENLSFSVLEGIYNTYSYDDNGEDLDRYLTSITNNKSDYEILDDSEDATTIFNMDINYNGGGNEVRYYIEFAYFYYKDEYETYNQAWQNLPFSSFEYVPYATIMYITTSVWVDEGTGGEVIDIPGLIYDLLGMPFAFISQAFNLTLFPGTLYQINISHVIWTVIGSLLLFIIIKKVILR